MNLHAVVAPLIGAINPHQLVSVRQSTGYVYNPAADGGRTSTYTVLGGALFTGSITGGVLIVTAMSAANLGTLVVGQQVVGTLVAAGTSIASLGSGAGGVGTYNLRGSAQVVASGALTATNLSAQVQELSTADLRQLDGLGIQGSTRAMYLTGEVDAVERVRQKGGDLVTLLGDGSTWLTTRVMERFPDWCKVSLTLQDGS